MASAAAATSRSAFAASHDLIGTVWCRVEAGIITTLLFCGDYPAHLGSAYRTRALEHVSHAAALAGFRHFMRIFHLALGFAFYAICLHHRGRVVANILSVLKNRHLEINAAPRS